MSDLQCAARIVVLAPSALEPVPGEEPPPGETLLDRLREQRVVAVYATGDVADLAPVLSLARELDVPGPALTPDSVDRDPTPTRATLLADDVIDDLADLHRGETVVLVRGDATPAVSLLLVDADGRLVLPFE